MSNTGFSTDSLHSFKGLCLSLLICKMCFEIWFISTCVLVTVTTSIGSQHSQVQNAIFPVNINTGQRIKKILTKEN